MAYKIVAVQPLVVDVQAYLCSDPQTYPVVEIRNGILPVSFLDVFQSDSSKMEIAPLVVTGSGSGASFFSLTSGTLRYIMKAAWEGPPRRRVQEEMAAYRALKTKGWDLPYLTPFLLEETSLSCLILPFLEGETTANLLRSEHGKDCYGEVFEQGIGKLLTLYKETCHVCENPRDWFISKTIAHALDPLQSAVSFHEEMGQSVLTFNGVEVPNGLSFFRTLGGAGDYPKSDAVREAIQWVLSPRYMAEVPTDPNTLNEMVLVKDGGVTVHWIDPGRVEESQLAYFFIKHEGMFAHVLPYMLQQELDIHVSSAGNYQIALPSPHDPSSFQRSKDLQGMSAVMSRLESHPAGNALLEQRPFFKVHFLFFAFRQFLRDLAYAIANKDEVRARADLAFFSLGMKVIAPVLEDIVAQVGVRFSGLPFASVVTDPQNKEILRAMTEDAYVRRVEGVEPEMVLYREWFGR